jgi:hypothetical protein
MRRNDMSGPAPERQVGDIPERAVEQPLGGSALNLAWRRRAFDDPAVADALLAGLTEKLRELFGIAREQTAGYDAEGRPVTLYRLHLNLILKHEPDRIGSNPIAPPPPDVQRTASETPVEIQALTDLFRSLARDAQSPPADGDWYLHGFMLGALLGTRDPKATRRYVRAVLANTQKRTGVNHAAIEDEYLRGVDELVRRSPEPQS